MNKNYIVKCGFHCALFLFIATFIIIIMAGCGKINKSQNAKSSIEYYSMWKAEEPQAEYLKQMAIGFEKETGINVKFDFIGRDVLTKVKSRSLMGNAPDLVDHDFNELSAAISIGSLKATDLESIFYKDNGPEGQKRLIDIFDEQFVRLYQKNGRLCLFPYEFITSGFFYDKNLYEKNGLNTPKTWNEFIKNNNVLNSHNIKPLAEDGNINFYNAYYYSWSVERVLGPGAFIQAMEDHSGETWDRKGYLQAAKMVYTLSKANKNYFQAGYEKSEWPTAQIEWAGGNYGNILCATWIPVETQKYTKPGFKYGFYPFPEVDGGIGKTSDVEIGFIGCVIPKGAKNIDGAISFLKFIMKKENAQKFSDMTDTISARNDVNYPQILSSLQDYVKNIGKPYKSYDGVWGDLPGLWVEFEKIDDKLIFGKISPDEFIKQVKQMTIDFWSTKK